MSDHRFPNWRSTYSQSYRLVCFKQTETGVHVDPGIYSGSTEPLSVFDNPPSRPKRPRQKPVRYRDSDHLDPDDILSEDTHTIKVKKVLTQRPSPYGIKDLVQRAGEPAQAAMWILKSRLGNKTLHAAAVRPPPLAFV